MKEKKIIHLWFEMWLTKQDLGIDDIFAEDVIYTESWCPKYNNRQINTGFRNGILVAKSLLGKSNNFSTKEIRRLWSGISKK